MRLLARSLPVLLISVIALARPTSGQLQDSSSERDVTPAQYEQWKLELSNWGRWGEDGEIGALNLITPQKRLEAVALVQEGFSVSLASDANTVQAVDNPRPYEHEMLSISSDRIAVRYHGITHTHIDALAHINDNGTFFDGYTPDADATLANGHEKSSIHNLKNGVLTRGVLIDIPRFRGLPYLEPGTPIYVEELEAWEEQTGVRISSGDALFIRTGVWARREVEGPWLRGRARGGRSAGLHPSVIPWLKERDVALLGSDHPTYVSPSNLPGAVHDFAILYLGIHMIDNADLEALGAAAAERGRWEFLLMLAPLAIPGGTGSPLNPIAVF